MPLNETWRAPRVRLEANGIPVSGLIEAEIFSTSRFAADQFRASIALSSGPDGIAFWEGAAGVSIAISISLDGTGYEPLFQGLLDTVSIDLTQRIARLDGRDLTSVFVESRLTETFPNRTSSEIATLLAQQHGISVSATPTTMPVGRYYQDEHDTVLLDSFTEFGTEWDLLVFLARWEGFDVYVSGGTLIFEPPASNGTPRFVTQADVSGLRLKRSLTLARDIVVTVKSWNSMQNAAVVQTVRAMPRGGPPTGLGIGPRPLEYVIVRPNLAADQALRLAQRRLAELTQHERLVSFTMPGDLSLSARDLVCLSGTGTSFDQIYAVDSITRSIGPHGFQQSVRLRNTPALSQDFLAA